MGLGLFNVTYIKQKIFGKLFNVLLTYQKKYGKINLQKRKGSNKYGTDLV